MSCIIYYLYGEAIPALMAEAKLKGGGAAQALNEALIDGNEIIAKFDGVTELPNHHRELICIAHLLPGVRVHVANDPELTAVICTHLEAIRARLRQRHTPVQRP